MTWDYDPRVYTELSYNQKVRVINMTQRMMGQQINPDIDAHMNFLLQTAVVYRASINKPVSAPPSPTHKARITHDTDMPEAPGL